MTQKRSSFVMSSTSASPPTRISPSPSWKCKYCPLSFTREHFLAMHTERYHEVERLHGRKRRRTEIKCDICGQRCCTFEGFLHHKLCHHNFPMMKHACRHCGKLFQTEAHYKMHNKVHMHVLPFHRQRRLFYCQKTFDREVDLRRNWTRTHGRRTESEERSSHSGHGTSEGEVSSSGVLGGPASPQEDLLITLSLNEDQMKFVIEAAPQDGNLLEEFNTDQIKMEITSEPRDANQSVQLQGGDLRVDFKTVDQMRSEVKSESVPSHVESFYASPIVLGTATPLEGMRTLCLNEDEMEFVAETALQDGNLFEDYKKAVDQTKVDASSDVLGPASPQDDPLPLPLTNEDQIACMTETTPAEVDYETTPPGITIDLNEGEIQLETRHHKVASQRAVFIMKPGTEGVVLSHDEGSVTFSGSIDKGGITVIKEVKLVYGPKQIPELKLFTADS